MDVCRYEPAPRFLNVLLGQFNILSAGEAVFEVPLGLPMTDEYQICFHGWVFCCSELVKIDLKKVLFVPQESGSLSRKHSLQTSITSIT